MQTIVNVYLTVSFLQAVFLASPDPLLSSVGRTTGIKYEESFFKVKEMITNKLLKGGKQAKPMVDLIRHFNDTIFAGVRSDPSTPSALDSGAAAMEKLYTDAWENLGEEAPEPLVFDHPPTSRMRHSAKGPAGSLSLPERQPESTDLRARPRENHGLVDVGRVDVSEAWAVEEVDVEGGLVEVAETTEAGEADEDWDEDEEEEEFEYGMEPPNNGIDYYPMRKVKYRYCDPDEDPQYNGSDADGSLIVDPDDTIYPQGDAPEDDDDVLSMRDLQTSSAHRPLPTVHTSQAAALTKEPVRQRPAPRPVPPPGVRYTGQSMPFTNHVRKQMNPPLPV